MGFNSGFKGLNVSLKMCIETCIISNYLFLSNQCWMHHSWYPKLQCLTHTATRFVPRRHHRQVWPVFTVKFSDESNDYKHFSKYILQSCSLHTDTQFLNLIFMDPCIVVWLNRNTNKLQLCNRIYYFKVYWRLNMFRAAHRSSSGALNCFFFWLFIPCIFCTYCNKVYQRMQLFILCIYLFKGNKYAK